MIIRTLDQIADTDRVVAGPTWVSRRLLLRSDNMGFSLHDTIVRAGTETTMHYRLHLEAVYCIEGEGTITESESGATHAIAPGTVYALDQYDAHVLRATTDMRMVCVFNPPLAGPEVHDESGAYPMYEESE